MLIRILREWDEKTSWKSYNDPRFMYTFFEQKVNFALKVTGASSVIF